MFKEQLFIFWGIIMFIVACITFMLYSLYNHFFKENSTTTYYNTDDMYKKLNNKINDLEAKTNSIMNDIEKIKKKINLK